MIDDFLALGWLEAHRLKNLAKQMRRQPGRLVMYVIVVAYFGVAIFLRSTVRGFGSARSLHEPLATAIACGAIAVAGLVFGTAASGKVGAFTSLADARFLIGSKLRERNVLVWLQFRSCWRMIVRFILPSIIYAVVFPNVGTPAGMILSLTGFTALTSAANVPIMRLRHAGFASFAMVGAACVVVLGVAGALLELARTLVPQFSGAAIAVQHLGLGRMVQHLLAGNAAALIALWAFALAAMGLSYFGSDDMYPELYASSTSAIELAARRKRNIFGFTPRATDATTPVKIGSAQIAPGFGGAWSTLWKDWVSFKRGRAAFALFLAFTLVGSLAGAAIGLFARRQSADDALAISVSLAGSFGNVLLIFLALGSSIALAPEIRKPIWWLSADSLRARLYAWTLASSWRFSIIGIACAVAWSIAIGNAAFGAFAGALVLVTVPFVRAIGLALYAVFPAKIEQRGPVAMMRMLLTYVLMGPAIALGIATGMIAHSADIGVGIGLVTMLVESTLLIEFAAFRIAGSGAGFAAAEEA